MVLFSKYLRESPCLKPFCGFQSTCVEFDVSVERIIRAHFNSAKIFIRKHEKHTCWSLHAYISFINSILVHCLQIILVVESVSAMLNYDRKIRKLCSNKV